MEIVPYAGWPRCAKLAFSGMELIVTLDVGPRVIHFGFEGGPNEFVVHSKDAGSVGDDRYHSYGGHRLWVAPEDRLRTLVPDNDPVAVTERNGWAVFTPPVDRWWIQKEIWIRGNEDSGAIDLHHRLYNRGAYEVEVALWALTQMAPGGELLVPQAPCVPPSARLLPVRPIVLWGYTEMGDPRYEWGDPVIRLRQDPSLGPTKFGTLVSQGYAAYANRGNVFLKRFAFDENSTYPDFNCNFESYTREDMLEVESLGPLVKLAPGEWRSHDESWHLIRGEVPPTDGREAYEWLERLTASRPLHRMD